MWQIEFSSDRFLPYLPEDSQVNPGVYGFELAHWLSAGLMKRDVPTSYPVSEDWGWFVEYLKDDLELMVCCSSQAEHEDGYKGEPIRWTIFIRAPGGFFKKARAPEQDRAVDMLARHVTAMLEQEGIAVGQA
jgi:hypothetical protein